MIPYAKAGGVYEFEGRKFSGADIEILDRKTGKNPVDEAGEPYAFSEVNAAEGWGIVFDFKASQMSPHDVMRRIEGDFEIRFLHQEP